MSLKNKKIQKLISLLVVISVIVPSILFLKPKKADAFLSGWIADIFAPITSGSSGVTAVNTTAQTGFKIKELAKGVIQEMLRGLARRALNDMTKSTVNWINGGFHGSPLFLENPQSFFKDIAKYEVKNFVDTIGYDTLRFPFGKEIALNTIYTYKTQFESNTQYSLSKVNNDQAYLDNYRNNFSVGGWDGLLLHTQYPQNNPIGFRMLATEELARRIDGTQTNAAKTVQNTLQQGLGFLSPQTCPSNPKYNNLKNQWQQPKFKTTLTPPVDDCSQYDDGTNPAAYQKCYADLAIADEIYRLNVADERTDWEEENGCPKGLVNTTPGSTVGSQVATALSSPTRNNELAIAMGNSVSAILDSLMNHFINKGLNALASKVNPPPPTDDWDYFGNTLGTVNSYDSTTWDSGPDEVIILSKFKREVDADIANTQIDIALLNNISKTLNDTWQEVRKLDQCVPGPDINWEERLREEKERSAAKLLEKSSDDDPEEAARARAANKELDYAVKFFEDWIKRKMLYTLPSSIVFMDVVGDMEPIYQESTEAARIKRGKVDALARLQSIKTNLALITTDPAPDSAEEKRLIDLRKQYNATKINSSNPLSIEDTRNQFNTAVDRINNIKSMTSQCQTERAQNGWGPLLDDKGNGDSIGKDEKGRTGTELDLFCTLPVVGGFSHGEKTTIKKSPSGTTETTTTMFVNPINPIQYPDEGLPMVNAKKIFKYDTAFGSGEVDVTIKCKTVHRANLLDYKGDIPGVTTLVEVPAPIDSTGSDDSGGQCLDTGSQYAGDLRRAMDTVLADNPNVAALPNIESGGRQNARTFLALVEDELISMGLNAADEVLNGNNNPSTGDIIAVWDSGDTMMERYDAIAGESNPVKTIAQSTLTSFEGFIPLNCTSSGGGNNCGCSTGTTSTSSLPASLLSDVQTERAKYATPMSASELGELLNTVAWNNRSAGWGLSRKTGGGRCSSPVGEIACDILQHKPTNTLWDVLIAADPGEGPATPMWSQAPHHNDPNRPWVAPVQP